MFDFEAAIFDLDGTIADSNYVWKKVDADFFGKRGEIGGFGGFLRY